jgi:hypothetical protein
LDTCCHILGIEYQNKAQQIESERVEAGKGDPLKTIRATRGFLEKLRWRTAGRHDMGLTRQSGTLMS